MGVSFFLSFWFWASLTPGAPARMGATGTRQPPLPGRKHPPIASFDLLQIKKQEPRIEFQLPRIEFRLPRIK
jgi:hypothetical protein